MSLTKIQTTLFAFFLMSCAATPPVPKISSLAQKPDSATPQPSPDEAPSSLTAPTTHSLIYTPHIEGDIEKLLSVLESQPDLRITLIFPPKYFEQADRKKSLDRFRILHSSKQIEIGLTLDNEPVLPLLADLSTAGEKVSKWGFSFRWPEDAAFQVARASSKYQKRWGQLPSGLLPPHFALSEDIVESLKRFRLTWVLGKNRSEWGVKFFGGLAMLIPAEIPQEEADTEGSRTWSKTLAEWAYQHPFVYLDASQWADPNSESVFLKEWLSTSKNHGHVPMVTLSEFVENIGDEYTLPKTASLFEYDYAPWVTTPLQRKAWGALADARSVIEQYKNSGRAQLQRLDAATEEIATAESGAVLKSLGENQSSNPTAERNFLATLSNIYRLCNTAVPANLNNLFSNRIFQKATPKPTENDRPFFIEGGQSLTWNDPVDDDNGDGRIVYPSGRYPKGSFDLRDFTISWTDSDITLSASLVSVPSVTTSFALPMLDVYIDINKFAGAGSTAPLRKRSSTLLDKEAAWEFAVVMSPLTAQLFQAVPGGEARFLAKDKSDFHSNSFSATFPRSILRGDPHQWRLTVGLCGTENSRKNEEMLPLPISSSAGERNFGGAAAGRSAPPYLDLLLGSSEEQKSTLSAYDSGARVVLPFIEGQ